MLEEKGNLWDALTPSDWCVITTNCTLKRDGSLVMGRGIALEAKQKWPWLPKLVGEMITQRGLHVEKIQTKTERIIIFPVKYEFYLPANINLIAKSARDLANLLPSLQGGRVLLGRPGCGNGRRDWTEVEPILRTYLTDNRFIVFSHPFEKDLKQR
jgi:hypothetical protein